MTKMDKEYIEKEYEQDIKEYNAALTEDDLDTARRTMKRLVRKGKRKAPEIRPSGAFLFRFGKGSLFLRLIVFYSSPSNYLQMK